MGTITAFGTVPAPLFGDGAQITVEASAALKAGQAISLDGAGKAVVGAAATAVGVAMDDAAPGQPVAVRVAGIAVCLNDGSAAIAAGAEVTAGAVGAIAAGKGLGIALEPIPEGGYGKILLAQSRS